MRHCVPRDVNASRMPPWLPEEIEMLYRLAGDMPFDAIYNTFRSQAAKNGWPMRTRDAIHCRAFREGITFRDFSGTYVTTGSIAAMLDLRLHLVNKWFLRHPDIPRRMVQGTWIYRRSDVKRWAKEHAYLLGGLKLSNLMQLFDDQKFCEWILENYPNRPTGCAARAAPVICIETGKRYPSHSAAARAHFVHRTTISLAVKTGMPVVGKYTFKELPQ